VYKAVRVTIVMATLVYKLSCFYSLEEVQMHNQCVDLLDLKESNLHNKRL